MIPANGKQLPLVPLNNTYPMNHLNQNYYNPIEMTHLNQIKLWCKQHVNHNTPANGKQQG